MRFLLICTLAVVTSCTHDAPTAGFSSSECVAQPHCPCNVYGDSIPIRGTFLGTTDGVAQVHVDELLQPETVNQALLTTGDHIGGVWDDSLPCGGTLALAPDDPVFALYVRGTDDVYPDCTEFRVCTDTTCGPIPTEEAMSDADAAALNAWDACNEGCIASTRDACTSHRADALQHGTIALTRWEDTVHFGDIGNGPIALPSDSLLLLQQGAECSATIPAGTPAYVPCDDTDTMSL